MKFAVIAGVWVLLTAVAASTAIVLLNRSGADDAYPDSPIVAGRLMSVVRSDSVDGPSALYFCEFDAEVNTDGALVTEVVEQGTGPQTKAGDVIVDAPVERQEPDWTGFYHIPVHWADGQLRFGCAPESRTIELPIVPMAATPAGVD